MKNIWYGIGQFTETLIDWFITPFGWFPVWLFVGIFAFGACYWLMWQGRYNRRAQERNELM